MRRIIKWSVIGLLALVVLAIGITWLCINNIVRSAVQSQATSQLGVQTTLAGANVSLLGGNVALSDLQIASPKGYPAPHIFTLGGTDVSVSLSKLRSTPMHVATLNVNKPTLLIEQQNMKLNFKALIDGMPSPPKQADKTADQKEPIKLIIDRLTVNDASIVIRPGEIPGVKLPNEISLVVPRVDLRNIGNADGAQNGAAIKEIVTQLITVLAAKASESDQVPKELRALMALNVNVISAQLDQEFNKQLDKVASEVTKKLPKDLSGALDTSRLTTQPAKAVEDGLKGILDNKSRKKKGN